jgi:hypothetical protein
MPWRNGWNAAQLACSALREFRDGKSHAYWWSEWAWLGTLVRENLRTPTHDPEIYWKIQYGFEDPVTQAARPMFLRAGLRCAQLMVANSSTGDGSIFNAILQPAFEASDLETNVLAPIVETNRCRDALGVPGPSLTNDTNDYLRRAFSIAWRRRLYAAAYSLPPAVIL